jgi:hypothetical protein
VRDDEPPQPTDNRRESPTTTDGLLRLTYDQIGKRLGMTADAARQLARRKGWPRTRPNTIGEPVVVSIPASELPSDQPAINRRAAGGEPSGDRRSTNDQPSVDGGLEAPSVNLRSDLHAQALAALEAALTAADARSEEALALADRLAAQLADASAKAGAEITTLRDAVDGMRNTLARAEIRAAHAEQLATEADARAALAEAAAAEQRVATEQARSEAAEAQRIAAARASLDAEAEAKLTQARADAERARNVAQEAVQAAEALQSTIDGLKAGQTTMQDTYAEGLAAAQHDAQRAQERADALARAEDARKARGRWARLRAAWRGE